MDLSVKVEGDAALKRMLLQLGNQAPHAIRMAANSVGEHMQASMQRALPERFKMRGTAEGFRQAVVFRKAIPGRQGRANAELSVGSTGVGRSRTKMLGGILARHEDASTRTTSNTFRKSDGSSTSAAFFVPAAGMRTSTQGIAKRLFPRAIGAAARRDVSGGYTYAKGVRRTTKRQAGESFVVTDKGIFRYRHTAGLGRDLPEPIWWFAKQVRTPARLKLWETAEGVFDRFAVGYIVEAIDTVILRSL